MNRSARASWRSWLARGAHPGLALAALLLAGQATAQNLLVNGDFSTALGRSSWLETGTWLAEDWQGAPGSGSLRITNDFTAESVLLGRQCVPIEAGRRYRLAASLRAAPGQFAGATTAAVTVAWWNRSDCYSGGVVASTLGVVANQTGAWERLGPTPLLAPAGAAGADVRLQVFKSAGSGSFTADFDGLLLELPEPGSGAAALAAAGALGLLARRRSPDRTSG
jgi:hypothetical protein